MKISRIKIVGLIVLTILLLILTIITSKPSDKVNIIENGINIIFRPFQDFALFVNNRIAGVKIYLEDIEKVKAENKNLKNKIIDLEDKIKELDEYKKEAKELREVLNIKDRFVDFEFIGVNIISKDLGNWFRIFTIDKGKKSGIEVNYSVITSKGLVGRVISVNSYTSKVISIIDKDSSVSARISKTRDLVVVNGDLALKDKGYCRMDYIPNDIELAYNDTVETSGLGGIFPKGLIIGKVKEINQSQNEFTKYAIIEPVVDFKRLEAVLVLKKK